MLEALREIAALDAYDPETPAEGRYAHTLGRAKGIAQGTLSRCGLR